MGTLISKIIFPIISKLAPLLVSFSFRKLKKNFGIYSYLRKYNLVKLKDDFDLIYVETLYRLIHLKGKQKEIISLFENGEVLNAFKEEIYKKSNYSFNIALDSNLHTNPRYRSLKNIRVELQNEILDFKNEFILVANETRTPTQVEDADSLNKLNGKIDQLIDFNTLNQKFGSKIEIKNLLVFSKSDVHQLVDHVSHRDLLVQEYLTLFSQFKWIMLNGSISTGKTQLTILLSKETGKNIYWINLRGIDIDKLLLKIFYDLSQHLKLQQSSEFGNWSKSILNKIDCNSLIVLDDLPQLSGRDLTENNLLEFILSCINKGVYWLSTSNYEVSFRFKELISSDLYTERTIPLLTINEVNEILLSFGLTPDYSTALKSFIHSISSGHPLIVKAICHYLSQKNWVFTHQEISDIFGGEYTSGLISETYEIISKTIGDSKTKDLLYRLKLIIGSFTLDHVNLVCNCSPRIDKPIERFTNILGLWVQQVETNKYEISPLIKIINVHDLNDNIENRIYSSLAKRILSKKILDQFDARKAILYFISSKSFNDAGFILIKMLNESLKHPKEFFEWGINLFWYSLPLPNEMDLALQVHIRVLQIFLNRQENKDISFLISDLERICESAVKRGIEVGAAYLVLSYYYAIKDTQKALKYLLIGNQKVKFLSLPGIDPILKTEFNHEMLVWGSIIEIETISEIDNWFNTIENLSVDQITDIKKSEQSDIGSVVVFRKIFQKEEKKPIEEQQWENVIKLFKHIQGRASSLKLDLISANAVRYIINIMSEKLKMINSAHDYAKTYIPILSNNKTSQFLINDAIGRQLYYNDKIDDATPYIAEAVEIDVPDFYIEKLDTYIVFSQILGLKDSNISLYYSKKAKDFVLNSSFSNDILRSKIIGEYAISLYLNKDIKSAIYALEQGYQFLVDTYNINADYHITILRYGHILNYWYSLISKGQPPTKDMEGNDYEPPARGIFLNNYKENLVEQYYFPERQFIVSFLMFNCFEFYLDLTLIRKWAKYNLLIHRNIEFNSFSLVLNLNIPYLIIDKKYLEAINLQVEVIDKTNNLKDGNYLNLISKNKNLQEIISKRPVSGIKDYDFTLIEFVITPCFFEFLSEYNDINSLFTKFQLIQDTFHATKPYLKDERFVDCIDKLFEYIKSQNYSIDLIIDIHKNYTGEFDTSLKTILYLFASIIADCKKALALQFALIFRLETIYFNTSKGTYYFILLPFLENFWINRIKANESEFSRISFLHSKSLPFYHESTPSSKIKNLFRILSNHLNYTPTEDQENWMEI